MSAEYRDGIKEDYRMKSLSELKDIIEKYEK